MTIRILKNENCYPPSLHFSFIVFVVSEFHSFGAYSQLQLSLAAQNVCMYVCMYVCPIFLHQLGRTPGLPVCLKYGSVGFYGTLGKYLGSFFSFFRNFHFLGFLGGSKIWKMAKNFFLENFFLTQNRSIRKKIMFWAIFKIFVFCP